MQGKNTILPLSCQGVSPPAGRRVGLVPWGVWLWQSSELVWPWLRRSPEWRGLSRLVWHGRRGLLLAYLELSLGHLVRQATYPCRLEVAQNLVPNS